MKKILFAAITATFLTVPAISPAVAHDTSDPLSFAGFDFTNPDRILDKLIELDQDDIKALETDLSDASTDILDAIDDIEDAREELRDLPGAGIFFSIAVGVAKQSVSFASEEALTRAEDVLVNVEGLLTERRNDVGEAEFVETSGAIDVLRVGLTDFRYAIDALIEAMEKTV